MNATNETLIQRLNELKSDSAEIRRKAVWFFGRNICRDAILLIIDLLNNDPDKEVRMEAAYSLDWINTDESMKALRMALMNDDEDSEIREAIGNMLIYEKGYYDFTNSVYELLDKEKYKDESTETVICPVCECEFCHIEKVSVFPIKGETKYVIDKSGVSLKKSFHDEWNRGATVKVQMFCEDGHIFNLSYQFHKGITMLNKKQIGEYDVMNEKRNDDLWRD
ncbi:MAG: hypothetical protein ACD_79C01283G0006 [uncultured bacterium]|nr:MAG: hypothetical protein ACD_79C01283G0006 [uncultured bacterium]